MSTDRLILHSAPLIIDEDIRSVSECLKTGMIARGSETAAFETEFASVIGFPFAKTTGSGASAITVALKSLGIGQGDEVVFPTYVCESVLYAVRATGATEVLCDTGPSWLMDVGSVSPYIGPRTKAIIAVNIFGIAVDIRPLQDMGIPVIEDCCQSFGRTDNGGWIGADAEIAVFSFHPTKCLTAGGGGMIVTSRMDIAQRIASMMPEERHYFTFNDLQAALARSQLRRYEMVLKRRSEIAQQYFENLPEINTKPLWDLRSRSMFFRFPVIHNGSFDEVRKKLANSGIHVRRGVDCLLHRKLGLPDESFSNAVRNYQETISIPILPQLAGPDVDMVAGEMNLLFKTSMT